MKILIVDDDPRLRELLQVTMERAGYTALTVGDGQRALQVAARESPDLIILDIGLPEMDGLAVCRQIRSRSEVPILFLTARDDEIDRILGFEMGADDYVTKPFSPREVAARVRAILKRQGGAARKDVLRAKGLELDLTARLCHVQGQEVPLTATEFTLLATLLQETPRLTARATLFSAVWGARSAVADRTLDSHLRNLRHKLRAASCPVMLETVHGQGVRLAPAP